MSVSRSVASEADGSPTAGSLGRLGLRLILAVDLAWLVLRRWTAYNASVRTLEVQGFPGAPGVLGFALLAGGVGAVLLAEGSRARWGAALAGVGALPVAAVFTAAYVPAGAGAGLAPWLVLGAFVEDLLLGSGLFVLFLLGGGRYTLGRIAGRAGRWLRGARPRLSGVPLPSSRTPPAGQTAGE
jgi:uncharacterized membrane protein YphA (DoxX/SURF4 family)